MEAAGSRSNPHTVFVLSDGTGITGERVVRAALTQFDSSEVMVERLPQVRSADRIREAMADAGERGATVLFSLVSPEKRAILFEEARARNLAAIDLLGPILRRLSDVLAVSPRSEPGLFHQLDDEYFRRIDAIDFAVKHDDGMMANDLSGADIVLVGVSRVSKTPLSMFLAYRGWRIANVPIILGMQPPEQIFAVPREKVLALTARPSWLEGLRRERSSRLGQQYTLSYADLEHIRSELAWFRGIAERGGWTVVDVTHKAIEETAAEIVALMPKTGS